MNDTVSKPNSIQLTNVLAEMNIKGSFPIAVITDMHGFAIAFAAGPDQDPDTQSAVVALIQKTATQVRGQLGMAQTDEITLYDKQGQRLVCRPFLANGHEMILAVLVPNKYQSYRRLTNQAIRTIQRLWK